MGIDKGEIPDLAKVSLYVTDEATVTCFDNDLSFILHNRQTFCYCFFNKAMFASVCVGC